jgi:hypothetical protein
MKVLKMIAWCYWIVLPVPVIYKNLWSELRFPDFRSLEVLLRTLELRVIESHLYIYLNWNKALFRYFKIFKFSPSEIGNIALICTDILTVSVHVWGCFGFTVCVCLLIHPAWFLVFLGFFFTINFYMQMWKLWLPGFSQHAFEIDREDRVKFQQNNRLWILHRGLISGVVFCLLLPLPFLWLLSQQVPPKYMYMCMIYKIFLIWISLFSER